MKISTKIVLMWLIVALSFAALVSVVRARDLGQWKYAAPDLAAYFGTLTQPDHPYISCCGEADAYWADHTDTDGAGNLIAIITDTRDDGPLMRPHVPVGTRIIVPASKIRKKPIPNPTGHTLIFLSTSQTVYCYEPLPGI